jgi:hypothetical protein
MSSICSDVDFLGRKHLVQLIVGDEAALLGKS